MSNYTKGILITGLGVLVLSPDGLLLRLITEDVLTITFWRGLFYSFGMFIVLSLYYRRKILNAFFKIGRPGLLLAVLYFLGNLSFIFSISHTAVANTLFIVSTTPLFAAMISWLFLKKHVSRNTWIAIGIASMGIIIICSGETLMPNAHLGNMAGLFGAFTLACSFTVIGENRDRDLLPSFVLGGFLMAICLEPFVSPYSTSDQNLYYLFLMGFVMLPIAATLMFMGPKFISAPEVGLMMLLESILGPLWVWMVLNEYPGDLVLVGGGIVLITLFTHGYLALRAERAKVLES